MNSVYKEKITKSKNRVKDQGEVYTPSHIVKDMVDMLGDCAEDYTKSVLEPSCGNGNFLVELLSRRLKRIPKRKKISDLEFLVLVTLSKIYGIDIMYDNVLEARSRLASVVSNYFSSIKNSSDFLTASEIIIERNIVHGDSLKHKSAIKILEWKPLYDKQGFEINPHTLAQIENDMKDVVTAHSISEIKSKVTDIFNPANPRKSIRKLGPKNKNRQPSLFKDIFGDK